MVRTAGASRVTPRHGSASARSTAAATCSASAASVPRRIGHATPRTPPACSATEYAASTPAAAASRRPTDHLPGEHDARHARARPRRAATAVTSLPRSDCQSKLPSPVTASSAVVERGVQPDQLAHQPGPGHPVRAAARAARRRVRRRRRRPARRARPRRTRSASTSAKRASAASSSATAASSAPFCGPNTAAAPCRPSSGLSTSAAATSRTPPSSDGAVQPGAAGQRGAAAGQRGAVGVHRDRAERGQHPGAAVGGGRAAQPDDDLGDAGVARVRDQLADPARGRGARDLGPRRSRGTRCSPHAARRLQVGGAADARNQRAGTGSPSGPVTSQLVPGAAERGVQHLDEAGAAVGEREQPQLVVGGGPAPAGRRSPRPPPWRSGCRRRSPEPRPRAWAQNLSRRTACGL